MSSIKSLLICLSSMLICLVIVNVAAALFLPSRFLPEKKMKEALKQGENCILFAGNSRMVSAYKKHILEKELQECTADVSIGSLDMVGITIAVREYVKKKNPKYVVLGFSGDMLLDGDMTFKPEEQIGNRIVVYTWGNVQDIDLLFPTINLHNFDDVITYFYHLKIPLVQYLSVFWIKAQQFQDKITGRSQKESNEFGTMEDMIKLSQSFTQHSYETFSSYGRDRNWKLHPWYIKLRKLLAEKKIPLIVVEIPMPPEFIEKVQSLESYINFQHWMKTDAPNYIDSSQFSLFPSLQFKDKLHFNVSGGEKFSSQLGRILKQKSF